MMKKTAKSLYSVAWAICLLSGAAHAASWQDQLSDTASGLLSNTSGNQQTANATDGGLSLGTITQLLSGGNHAIAASSLTNATGVLQYCIKNKVINSTNELTDQLKSKLGLTSSPKPAEQTSYQQGIAGLLNTGSQQKLDLNALGETELGKQLKTKACNVVLEQGKSYLGLH